MNGRQDVRWPKIRQINVMICLSRLNGFANPATPLPNGKIANAGFIAAAKKAVARLQTLIDESEDRLMLQGHPRLVDIGLRRASNRVGRMIEEAPEIEVSPLGGIVARDGMTVHVEIFIGSLKETRAGRLK